MYSYVTLLSNNLYIDGVITLNKSLILNKSKFQLTVMVTENILESEIYILQNNKMNVVKVPEITPSISIYNENIRRSKDYFNNTFSKLNALNLDYNKIIFLDADMLPLINLDHLFDEKHLSACLDNPKTAKQHLDLRNKINSGLFVIEPSEKLFNDAMDYLSLLHLQDKPLGDQDVLQNCFNWNILNQGYNVFASDLDCYEEPMMIYNLHYIMMPKPWFIIKNIEDIPYRRNGNFPFKTISAYNLYKTISGINI